MANKILYDALCLSDKLSNRKQQTLWSKTQILCGPTSSLYKDRNGISQLGEVIFEEENMVPIGGVQYAMEKIYGVQGPSNISNSIGYLNTTHQIGSLTYTPTVIPYPYDHSVCLWGIGTGGAAENNSTVLPVTYKDTEITNMIPFRYTNETFQGDDAITYYGKKSVTTAGETRTGYFLKKFDTDPEIIHQLKTGELGVDGAVVDSALFNTDSTVAIETFTQCQLRLKPVDVKEWFDANSSIEYARINSIALYDAVYDPLAKDYAMIRLFSKLNIPTEHLSLVKDLTFLYRVYGS